MRKVGVIGLAIACGAVAAAAPARPASAAALSAPPVSSPPESRAQDAGVPAPTMTCEHVDAPGRVRCEVEARVADGESITWGDVVIVQTPDFVGALRGRIGPHDATTRDAHLWRWALALVARGPGTGDVQGRVRLVVCRQGTCAPRELPVTGHVHVGT